MLSCCRSGQLLHNEGSEMEDIQASGLPNAMNLVRLLHHLPHDQHYPHDHHYPHDFNPL